MPKLATRSQIAKAKKLYEREGATLAQVSREVGLSRKTVKSHLEAAGVEIRTGGRARVASDSQRAEIVKLYGRGDLTNAEILERVGLGGRDAGLVYSALRASGASRRKLQGRNGKTLAVGATAVAKDGYVTEKVPSDWPFLGQMHGFGDGGWIRQHRKVMAEHLGRPLLSSETVHHIDGDKSNNAIENLQLVQGPHPAGVAMRCCSCGSTELEPYELEG